MMTFDELLANIIDLLQRQGRVSYGALKRRFELDDAYLQDLKDELINAQRLAVDDDGRILVWSGNRSQKSRVQDLEPEKQEEDSTPQTLDTRHQILDSAAARRQLTILFCGLLEPEQQATGLEAEDISPVLHDSQALCASIVARYEGYVAQYLSDGLLVYFGYPVAHEDDAQRAVWTGLEMVTAAKKQNHPPERRLLPMTVRIGIHTGMVIVDTVGAPDRREPLALGTAPKVAARLQGIAEANTVVLSAATHRLVQETFMCQALGPRTLKGMREPVEVYQVMGTRQSQEHEETMLSHLFPPLIGREEDLRLCLKRWEQVKEGHGQGILLRGEAGIGKSRFVRELRSHFAADNAWQLVIRCSSYHQQHEFYPLIDLFQRALQFVPEDTPQEKLAKIERALSTVAMNDALPLVAAFLSIPLPHSPVADVPPQRLREQMIQMSIHLWLVAAERQPLVLIWEDLHWVDPSTLELLPMLIDQIPRTRILVVATFRPEFIPPWQTRSYLTPLTLDRLRQDQVQAIIGTITGGKTLPPEVTRQIVAKTDGVPLFVEELTKMVLESGLLLVQEGHYLLKGPLPPLAIPTTLQDSLLARLDRLGEAREIAQLGSVFGRSFSYALLKAVATCEEGQLRQSLAKLVQAEVLYRRGEASQEQYLFKHALIQEAAYQSLLKSQRQQYHQRVAQTFAEHRPEIQQTQPELLAHHYTEAGLSSYALPYWQRAGQNALARSAFTEAAGYLTKGRLLLHSLPETPERMPQEIELYLGLGSALMAQKGYSAPEVEQVYAHALDLCRRLGETPRLLQALSGLTVFYLTRAEFSTARELGEQCLTLARRTENPVRLLQSLVVLGNVLFYAGEFRQAYDCLQEGLALYDPQVQGTQRALQDPGVNSLCYLALSSWFLGYPEQAQQKSEAALALAQQLNRPLSQIIAHVLTAGVYQFCREPFRTFKHAEIAAALASEQDLTLWLAYAKALKGWALTKRGEGEEGILSIRQGLAMMQDPEASVARPWLLLMLAESFQEIQQFDDSLAIVAEALDLIQRTGERMCEAELYRLYGELLLRVGKRENGRTSDAENEPEKRRADETERTPEACFLKAIAVAQVQQAKSCELRATLRLARVWQHQGKVTDAREILAPISTWFTEGTEAVEVQEAKTLLAQLDELSVSGARE